MDTVRLFGHYVQGRSLMLAALEAAFALLGLYLAALAQQAVAPLLFEVHGMPSTLQALTFLFVVMVCVMSLGMYQMRLRDGAIRLVVRLSISLFLAAVAMAVLDTLVPALIITPGLLIIALAFILVAIAVTHIIFFQILDAGGMKQRILFYGAGNSAAGTLAMLRRKTDKRLFNLMGCVSLPEEAEETSPEALVELHMALDEYAREHKIDEIVLAMDDRRGRFPSEELMACRLAGVEVTNMLSFYERHTGRIRCELLRPSDIILSEGFRRRISWDITKRVFDLVITLLLMIPALPLILVAAAAIKLEDGLRAPVFYRQKRVGQSGETYRIIKMRSMRVDAEQQGGARWATTDDDRVTRVGAMLRKYRIDELPQLFNVLKGDMALVGPRPERPVFVDYLSEKLPFYSVRHRVKPGITGWAQLLYPYGSTDNDALQKLEFDLYYVKNGGLFLDLVILVGTVEVILFGKGAR